MSRHILVKEIDTDYAERLPDFPPQYRYLIECPEGNRCEGWAEYREAHEVDGVSANDGPDDCEPEALWAAEEEFDFHGATHTWKYGWGWTVAYPGCVVQGSDFDPPDELYALPVGRYVVEDDWDDRCCYLQYIGAEA